VTRNPSKRVPTRFRSWRKSELPVCEREYRDGDRMALAHAIAVCLKLGRAPPKWAADAYVAGYLDVMNYRADSWDHVFGPTTPKGKHVAVLRKQRRISFKVWSEVQQRHEAGAPLDDQLYEAVGQENGIGKTAVKEYFAAQKQAFERALPIIEREQSEAEKFSKDCNGQLEAAGRALEAGKPELARKLMNTVKRRLARYHGAGTPPKK